MFKSLIITVGVSIAFYAGIINSPALGIIGLFIAFVSQVNNK